MKIKPILFNAEMIRALLEGRKTQTRRVISPYPRGLHVFKARLGQKEYWFQSNNRQAGGVKVGNGLSPYQKGDLLYVRESFSLSATEPYPWYWADGNTPDGDYEKPKPNIHMPRDASRITLEVTGVQAERLQDINEEDAIAEGAHPFFDKSQDIDMPGKPKNMVMHPLKDAKDDFFIMWNSIYGEDPDKCSGVNPYVWVYEFRVIKQNVDTYVGSLKAEATE